MKWFVSYFLFFGVLVCSAFVVTKVFAQVCVGPNQNCEIPISKGGGQKSCCTTQGKKYICSGECILDYVCSCDNSGTSNAYHCSADGNKTQTPKVCNDQGAICYNNPSFSQIPAEGPFKNQHITGIKCDHPSSHVPPLGPPPSPPCATFDANGKCTSAITPFGNISTDPGKFISRLFGILLAASGMIALLLIMRAGYRFMTSRGNPEGIQQAREQLIATIVGLLFLIFSFVILQVIGVDILGIPGASPSGSEAPRSGGEESGVRTNDPGADQSACTAAGGSCSSSQLCAGNGSSLGRLDCSSNQVCCKFQ